MHLRNSPLFPVGQGRVAPVLAWLILTGLVATPLLAFPSLVPQSNTPPSPRETPSLQYLSSIGAPTLRLQEPVAVAPPLPSPAASSTSSPRREHGIADDFIPFFQPPGGTVPPERVNLIVAVPLGAPGTASLPPSSATYTQTLK